MTRRLRTITAGEMLDLLENLVREAGPDVEVVFSADYGDMGQTEQAIGIAGEYAKVSLAESAYSDSGWEVLDTLEEEDDEDAYEVYVIV